MMHQFFVKPGTTGLIVPVFVAAPSTLADVGVLTGQGSGTVLFGDITKSSYYRPQGAAKGADVVIAMATMTVGSWASGGWVAIDATNMPGWYQFGVPDAALLHGSSYVAIGLEIPDTEGSSVQILIHLVRSLAY
jgi:hypothetical protein